MFSKYFSSLILSTTLLSTMTLQANESPRYLSSEYEKPKIINAINFEANYDKGYVTTSWKRYKKDDFAFYEVIKSRSNKDQLPANIRPLYSTNDPNQTYYNHQGLEYGIWYYRVYIVTKDKKRWMSPIVQVSIQENIGEEPIVTSRDFE